MFFFISVSNIVNYKVYLLSSQLNKDLYRVFTRADTFDEYVYRFKSVKPKEVKNILFLSSLVKPEAK